MLEENSRLSNKSKIKKSVFLILALLVGILAMQAGTISNTAAFAASNYYISISSQSGGITNPSAGIYSYSVGTTSSFTAIPNSGYKFDHWIYQGSIPITQNPLSFVSNSAGTTFTLVATFTTTQTQTILPPPTTTTTDFDYIVYPSGSTYYIKSVAENKVLKTLSDFGEVIKALNSFATSGNTIQIQNGVYIAYTTPNITVDNVKISGQDNTIIQASSSLTGYLFKVNSITTGVTVDNLIFDANYNSNISPAILVAGSYATIQYCTLKNAIQYGILAYGAQNFQFLHNTVVKAQYGISTGGDSGTFAANGIIAYNSISDCRDVGIKLRWVKNTKVLENDIDTAYKTWGYSGVNNGIFGTSIGSNSPITGCIGVSFYEPDGPVVNCVVQDNVIYDSKQTYKTCGILVDPNNSGSSTLSSGQVIIGNRIEGTYFGILARSIGGVRIGISNDGSIDGNTIFNVRGYGIVLGWTVYSCPGALVYNNVVSNSGIYGILISSGTNGCYLKNNSVTGSIKLNIVNNGSNNSIN